MQDWSAFGLKTNPHRGCDSVAAFTKAHIWRQLLVADYILFLWKTSMTFLVEHLFQQFFYAVSILYSPSVFNSFNIISLVIRWSSPKLWSCCCFSSFRLWCLFFSLNKEIFEMYSDWFILQRKQTARHTALWHILVQASEVFIWIIFNIPTANHQIWPTRGRWQ